MKNEIITYFFVSICIGCIFAFSSCKTKKNISRTEEFRERTERVETKTDTSRVITKIVADMEESVSIQETTDRETIHLDSIGRVRTIVRESVKNETGQRRTDRGQGSVVSITGRSESDSASVVFLEESQEKTKQDVDSRLVQGTEWIWVILSVALILAVVIYILYNKYYKKWQ